MWREYTAAITNPDEATELANNIKNFQKAAPDEIPGIKPLISDDRTVRIKLNNPDSEFTSDRSRGKTKTIFSQGENPAVYGGRESDTC